jgi:hypothetical protein
VSGPTPGPWRVDGFNEVLAGAPSLEAMVVGQGDYIVAQMVPERDAHLIAAAPALLVACKAWVTYDCRPDNGPNAGVQMMLDYDTALTLTRAAIASATTGEAI